MARCTVSGIYLNSYNGCDSFAATVIIELSGENNFINYSSRASQGCGVEFLLSTSNLNNIQSIYFEGSRPNTSGAISAGVFSSLIWLGMPTVSCIGTPPPPPPQIQFDCVNGACIKKEVYGTPGLYKSLSDCETACGTGCSGKCISNSEWIQIEGLSNQLKNINCG